MTDLTKLSDAFAELERRADTATSATTFDVPVARGRLRWPLVAAAALGVAAVAGGVAVVAQSSRPAAAPVAGGHSVTPRPTTPAPVSATASVAFRVPDSPDELARRFRVVLGNSATFTVTDTGHAVTVRVPSYSPGAGSGAQPTMSASPGTPNGAAIVGTLTAAGVTGGFDLQIFTTTPGSKAFCDSPTRCSITRLADGSSIAIGRSRVIGGGMTYEADLIRADGVEFLMHVSNERDPKGESTVLANRPPLTQAQMKAIVTSGRW